MERRWISTSELADAIKARAAKGKTVTLSPETAQLVAQVLEGRQITMPATVDVFSQGSAVYRVNEKGDIAEIVAFARSALAARAAFDYLCNRDPRASFEQRRRAWVEADRIIKGDRRT